MIRTALVAAFLTLASTSLAGQHCATFSVSGTGHRNTMMTFVLESADADAPALLAVSEREGDTVFSFGSMGMLHLGLSQPLHFIPMGRTDHHGHVSLSWHVPHHMMSRVFLFGQCLTARWDTHHHHRHLMFCTSNVLRFGFGGMHG